MCDTCGCSGEGENYTIRKPGETEHWHEHSHSHLHSHGDATHEHSHSHHHAHRDSMDNHRHPDHELHTGHPDHDHGHSQSHSHTREIAVEQDILAKNNLLAEWNRGWLAGRNILCINLVSSPGSGKTALLERTILDLGGKILFSVIEGDQQTTNDADRIHKTGAQVIQINTGNGCHLDASMINRALGILDVQQNSVLMIENVGNLVCPSLFDLGEKFRVVVMSVTEGEDKPVKYPTMFHSADVCIINKTDLLPHLDFSMELARENALKVKPGLKIFEMSVRTGEGLDRWYAWLEENRPA